MEIRAEMVANVWRVRVKEGATVGQGDELIVLESMKMEIPVTAPTAGKVTRMHVAADDVVQQGDLLCELD